MATLDDSLAIATRRVSADLVPPAAVDLLRSAARKLAPVHCAGFEVRLAEDADAVDLVQRFGIARGEPRTLARHIRSTSLGQNPAWQRVATAMDDWMLPSSPWHRAVPVAFAGFDAATLDPDNPEPSLYLSLEPGVTRAHGTVADILRDLAPPLRGGPLSEETLAAVDQCQHVLPEGSAITDVGFMLSRDIDAVRIVVAHVPRTEVEAFAAELAWMGTAPEVGAAEQLLPAVISHVLVSLDVGTGVYPRLGLEYYPGHAETDLPAWESALDRLVDAGLCSNTKRAALLRWPGYLEPTDATATWPDALVAESLLNRSDQFLVLARRLTFLKLVCEAGKAPHAKAYFGYGPRSFAVADNADDGTAAASTRESAAVAAEAGLHPSPAECASAASRAQAFLEAAQRDDGSWREFPRILGGTDEWVTGYVGRALAQSPGEKPARAASKAWDWLSTRRGAGDGWGYNAALPADADSTLWGLLLADALDVSSSPRATAAVPVLRAHQVPNGVATYAGDTESGLRDLLGDADLSGMFVAHTCVTAAAAMPEGLGADAAQHLPQLQEPDGRWRGYWWSDDEYTTWLAVDALIRGAEPTHLACTDTAIGWASRRFDRNGQVWSRGLAAPSVFATSLCVEIVLASPPGQLSSDVEASMVGALAWILAQQRDDGSWEGAALMRMPPTNEADGDTRPEATTVSADESRLFTTATVMRMLQRAAMSRD